MQAYCIFFAVNFMLMMWGLSLIHREESHTSYLTGVIIALVGSIGWGSNLSTIIDKLIK